jgi:hypothetical protein|tara:strand:+ start:116 stop:259 length:144 start_codon:yes stop_codon:yes gene_type:complete
MIKSRYKNTLLLKIIQHYLLLSDEEKEALSDNEKELLTYYDTNICIK